MCPSKSLLNVISYQVQLLLYLFYLRGPIQAFWKIVAGKDTQKLYRWDTVENSKKRTLRTLTRHSEHSRN